MVRMMTHADASELLGAYALDAVEGDEAAAVEAHLETCPRCRAELRSHLEVVGLLAYAGQEAPEGLWDRVVARINDPGEPDAAGSSSPAPHGLKLVRVDGDAPAPAGPVRGADVERSRRSRRVRRYTQITSFVAAAALVIVALLGVEVTRLQNRTNHLSGQVASMAGQPTMADVRQAISTPGARLLALRALAGGQASLDAVILPGGQGYLYDTKLVPLSSAQTYQLWGIVGGQRISYGVLGSTPMPVVAFRASPGFSALALTAEVAGGVVSSTHTPVAVGVLDA